ncbi:hypothetical protein [Arcobacter sp.]
MWYRTCHGRVWIPCEETKELKKLTQLITKMRTKMIQALTIPKEVMQCK